MNEPLYRVCWRSKVTLATGSGSPTTRAIADAWVETCNREHPDIHQWAEAVR